MNRKFTETDFKNDLFSRNDIRKESLSRTERLITVDFNKIALYDDFNQRVNLFDSEEEYEQHLDIARLAEGIYVNNGPADPIMGDFLKDGFFITEGERRYRAIKLLLSQGKDTYPNGEPINVVLCLCNDKDMSALDRYLSIYNTQNKLYLTPVEVAKGYSFLKENFGLSNAEIAEKYGVSRQAVDNYINIYKKCSKEVLLKLHKKEITVNEALLSIKEKSKERLEFEASQQLLSNNTTTLESSNNVFDATSSNGNNTAVVNMDTGEIIESNSNSTPLDKGYTVDTKAADKAEENSHKTSGKYVEPKENRKKIGSSLDEMDAKEEKTLVEMELDGVIKMLDSLEVKAEKLQVTTASETYKKDTIGFINLLRTKLIDATDRLKRI